MMRTSTTSSPLLLDAREGDSLWASNGACWQAISDRVMGGVSDGQLEPARIEGRPCLCLGGQVRLDHNGGFIQASLDLNPFSLLDARDYAGIEIEVYGNDEQYNLHLRSADTRIVWQSYRASFKATPRWRSLLLPFDGFKPYRVDTPLDLSRLRRISLVAIGREMAANLCFARVALYPGARPVARRIPCSPSPAIPCP